MKETPILFKGDMVRAILDGRKTQTRRVIKPQPVRDARDVVKVGALLWHIGRWIREGIANPAGWAEPRKCPFGDPGDLLWVRETWAKAPNGFVYRADYNGKTDGAEAIDICSGDTIPLVWKPSIHMPRKASRITLEVVNIRVERVQTITDKDIQAEGITMHSPVRKKDPLPTPRSAFAWLWDDINAARGFSWDANPWVWVVDFRKVGE